MYIIKRIKAKNSHSNKKKIKAATTKVRIKNNKEKNGFCIKTTHKEFTKANINNKGFITEIFYQQFH